MEPDLGKGLEALSGAKLRATAPGCRQKPVLEAEGNRFTEAEHSNHPEKPIQGELDPQKVEVHCKQEGGAKVTEAESPLLLLPTSTVCGGCKNGCKEQSPGSQEGFVMKVGCVQRQVLWEQRPLELCNA